DRRVGKRTLIRIKDDVEKLPEWVKQFYRLRCEAENINFQQNQTTDETVVCLSSKKAKSKDYVEIGADADDSCRIKDSGKRE
ncbi:MAG: hypothetical protein K6G17_04700, partial [Oscillospiraceae bacterium]|nr:hypothetical protein [Oscillospiraceae bacterium]